jgi:hypothetical protein
MECAREELTAENKNSRVMTFPRLQTLRVHEPRLSGPAEVVAQRRSGFLARRFAGGHKESGWKARPTQIVLRSHLAPRRENELSRTVYAPIP